MIHKTYYILHSKTNPAGSQIYKEILDARWIVVENSITASKGCRSGCNSKNA